MEKSIAKRQAMVIASSDTGYRRSNRHCFSGEFPCEWPEIEEAVVAIADEGNQFRKVLMWASSIARVIRKPYDLELFRAMESQIDVPGWFLADTVSVFLADCKAERPPEMDSAHS